jgi:Flp pilus assembly pilin Flp
VDILEDPRLRERSAQAMPPCSSSDGAEPISTNPSGRRWRRLACEIGATGIEYALIACLIAIAITIGTTMAGNGLNKMFYVIGNKLMTASNVAGQNSN